MFVEDISIMAGLVPEDSSSDTFSIQGDAGETTYSGSERVNT
jgi:hypothetical protein